MALNVNEAWGNTRRAGHRGITRRHVEPALGWWQPSTPKPTAWDDVANWKDKNVMGLFNGQRQSLHIMGQAPEGNDGERWYVAPSMGSKFAVFSVLKSNLELTNPYALAIRPPSAIIIYKGA